MTPRIPIPEGEPTSRSGRPTAMAPIVTAARNHYRQTAMAMTGLDPVTTEVVRIRNARYQQCFL